MSGKIEDQAKNIAENLKERAISVKDKAKVYTLKLQAAQLQKKVNEVYRELGNHYYDTCSMDPCEECASCCQTITTLKVRQEELTQQLEAGSGKTTCTKCGVMMHLTSRFCPECGAANDAAALPFSPEDEKAQQMEIQNLEQELAKAAQELETQFATLGKISASVIEKLPQNAKKEEVVQTLKDYRGELQKLSDEVILLQGGVPCTECGTLIKTSVKFCPNCGAASVSNTDPEQVLFGNAEAKIPENPLMEFVSGSKKPNAKTAKIIAGAVAAVLLIFLVLNLFGAKNPLIGTWTENSNDGFNEGIVLVITKKEVKFYHNVVGDSPKMVCDYKIKNDSIMMALDGDPYEMTFSVSSSGTTLLLNDRGNQMAFTRAKK